MKPIQMADLAARHAEIAASVEPAVLDVLRSGRFIGGPVVARAESAVAQHFGRSGAVGVASGTDAIALGLQALGVHPGDRVAVPALTFFATAGAVCAIGAVPVVVDVDDRGLMCPTAFDAIASDITAVVPVHLFGNRCTIDAPCLVLDDAAQAAGAEPATSAGTLTAVSAYPTKAWSCVGDGGFVVGDAEAVERVRRLGSHGAVVAHEHEPIHGHVGRNSRLDALQAAAFLGQVEALPRWRDRRRHIARRYDEALTGNHRPLPRDPGSAVPSYIIDSTDRDALREHLAARGIHSTIYYPRAIHRQPALAERIAPTHCPVADRLTQRLLAIPVHAQLSDADVERVVHALATA